LRERFIKNKRPLNPTHIFPKKKKKQLEIRTTIRAIQCLSFKMRRRRLCRRGREDKRILE
jgi:hypothetical protein